MADLIAMLGAAAGAAAGGGEVDPYFNQTTLLLHGDGTNGAQNNTFLDSSTNNFTITRNGNTTQGTFSPFSAPDGRWSNYFNAPTSADGVVFPADVALQPGTSDFAIEFWVYMNSVSSDVTFVSRGNTGSFFDLLIQFRPSVSQNLRVNTLPNSYIPYDFAWTPSANTWYHIAVTRSGTDLRAFVDGTQIGSTQTDSQNMNQSVNFAVGFNRQIPGQNLGGYLSNLRFVKGSAVYTANFSVPTSPLTAIANTQLLTCQSNRFVDNSSNGFAATTTGTPSVQPFSPFAPSAAYDSSVNGGSGYFDGSGDYLTVPDDVDFDLPADFTFEFWAYNPNSNGKSYCMLGDYQAGQNGLIIYTSTNNLTLYSNGAAILSGSSALPVNAWTHIAVVRSGGGSNNLKIYVNGVQDGQVTNTTSFTGVAGNGLAIGAQYGGGYAGITTETYISNFRLVKGTAVYTAAFTPPTSPVTAVSGTSLLTNFTNAGIFDNTGKNNLETVGNAQIDTTTKKYGTGSMEFDGSGDYLFMPATPNLTFGSGDFTWEAWIYPNSLSGTLSFLYGGRPAGTNGAYPVLFLTSSATTWYVDSASRIAGAALSTGQWSHLVVCRSGSSTKMFINGVQTGSTYTDTTNYLLSRVYVGTSDFNSGTSEYFNGFIDDLRITKGVARYTANFTPPSRAFPDL